MAMAMSVTSFGRLQPVVLKCRSSHLAAGSHLHGRTHYRVLRAASLAEVERATESIKKVGAAEVALEDETEPSDISDGLNAQQIGTFLTVLCDETDIAEIEFKVGSFEMKVRRNIAGENSSGVKAAPVIVAAPAPVAHPVLPVLPPPVMSPMVSTATLDEDDMLERLVMIRSSKVGVFRGWRYMKGKRVGKGPLVAAGERVKKGQALGYVEQMGTFNQIEAPQGGEMLAVLKEDGDPVEYNEILFELAPFFGSLASGSVSMGEI